MANFVLNEGQMFIFTNSWRNSDSQPTHKGSTKIEGVDYDVACWGKEGQNGKFFSCKISLKGTYSKKEEIKTETKEKLAKPDFDDDIPF